MLFWETGVLRALQRTIFFCVGLNFVFQGVQEQYDLVSSQFQQVLHIILFTMISFSMNIMSLC